MLRIDPMGALHRGTSSRKLPVEKHKIRSGLQDWLGQSWFNIEVCTHAMAANYTGAQIMPEFFSASTFVLGNAD
jgi:hypothetical protein